MHDFVRGEQSDDDGDPLGKILAEYFTRLDRGEPVSRDDLLAAHPERAGELRDYFADAALIGRMTGNESPPSAIKPAAPVGRPGDFGDYELLEEIGRGGMGIVYMVRERTTGRLLALKMLLAGLFASQRDIERFRNEARAAANLTHPAIVPIYHVGEHQGHLFYTMPWIAGTNLARRLAERPFDPRAAAELLATVADAVDDAHTRGVIHRDLKPANILLDESGKPYVADFGLARRLGEDLVGLTATGDMIGTPNYMAPEQVKGSSAAISAAADIYALGAVLYAMLVGRPPFQSASIPETLHRICSAEPARPRAARRVIPRDLETICLKCLEKPAARRYPSARALAEDLRRFLSNEPIAARPVGPVERGRRWFARNPVVGSLAVGIAASLVAGAFASTYYAFQAHARALEAHASEVQARERERQAVRNLYAADMSLAQQYAKSGWIESAADLLERHRPAAGAADERGWEWHYAWRQCHGELRRFEGHQGALHAAAFSPEGRLLAAGCADKNVYVWDTATGKLLHTLPGHHSSVTGVAFSPDGQRLASVGGDQQANIWDTASGNKIANLAGGDRPLTTVAWSSDGHCLATGGSDDPLIRLWDGRDFHMLHQVEAGPTERLVFAPTNPAKASETQLLAIAGRNGSIRICRANDGVVVATVAAHQEPVHGLAFSPDGTRLASSAEDRSVKLWDARSWKETASFHNFGDSAWGLAFSPDGNRLAGGGRSEPVKVWDIDQPQHVTELRGHTALVTAVAFCPTDGRLVSASEDGTLRLWDSGRSTEHDTSAGHTAAVFSVAFSPDSRLVASAGLDNTVILWDAATSRPLRAMRSNAGIIFDVAFSADGTRLAAAEHVGRLRTWDVATGQECLDVPLVMGPLRGIAFSPNGEILAVGSHSGPIKILDADSGSELATLSGHVGGLGRLAFNPRGDLLASCGADKIVRIWNVATREVARELRGHTAPVLHVAFSRDGWLLASSSNDHSIRVWDVATGQMVCVITGHGGTVWSVHFSPDGKRLVSGSADRTVKVWDVDSGLELHTLEGNTQWVRDVAISPDGNLIASAGKDHCVRIWNAGGPSTDRVHPNALVIEREATSIVDSLAARFHELDPTLAAIRSVQTIDESVRAAALRQAKQHLYYWDVLLAGHAAADRGDWPATVEAFERVLHQAPDEVLYWHWLAIANLAAGNRAGYDKACREMLKRIGPDSSEHELINCLLALLVVPREKSDSFGQEPLVTDLFKRYPSQDVTIRCLYEVRTGREHLLFSGKTQRPTTLGPSPGHWYILALIHLRTGDRASAEAAYRSGVQAKRAGIDYRWWPNRVFADELQKELEETFANRGVRQGD